MQNFAFLSNHFGFEIFNLNSNNPFVDYIKKYYAEDEYFEQFEYGYVLIEFKTNYVFECGMSTTIDFNFNNFTAYLQKLPKLTANNINILLTLTTATQKLCKNPFVYDEDYACKNSQLYFAETYGKILYKHQFRELLDNAHISEKTNKNLLPQNSSETLEYLRRYNCREAKIFEILGQLYTPHDTPIAEILKHHTPIQSETTEANNFGFVVNSRKTIAIEFVKRAQQYLSQKNTINNG